MLQDAEVMPLHVEVMPLHVEAMPLQVVAKKNLNYVRTVLVKQI